MSAQWAVGEAEMRRASQPKRAMRPLQDRSATIEVAEGFGPVRAQTQAGSDDPDLCLSIAGEHKKA